MQDQTDEVLALVREGESQTTEFKERLPKDGDLARHLVAFANSGGGNLLIGVRDDGQIIGLSDSRLGIYAAKLHNISENVLGVPVRISPVVIDGLTVLWVRIAEAPEHSRPLRTATGTVYVREGARVGYIASSRLDPDPPPIREIRAFVAMALRFDEEPALVDYFEAIKRAVAVTNLPITIDRMDLIEGDYEITNAIAERIAESDIVIADFTLNSPNVYYEAGVAKGAKKYTIRLARRDTELPFDVRTWSTIIYVNATQLEGQLVGALRSAYAAVTAPSE